MVEVIGLSPEARWEDVYWFFINCGNVKHLEILRVSDDVSMAHVEFEDADSVKIALFLSGSEIANQPVAISSCGKCNVDLSPYLDEAKIGSNNAATTRSDPFVSAPGEAVTVVQDVVHTMISKGYVLGKDALSKAKAFDESHQFSSKIADLSKRIGLTDKINSGMQAAKCIDETYHVREMTKSAAAYSSRTAVAAANAVVNSSYFAKGALWVSDVLDHAAKAAADLGHRNERVDK